MNVADPEATRDSAAAFPGVGGAAGIVTGWQPAMLEKITSALGLTPKDHAELLGFDSFTIGGANGKVVSFDGPGLPNVAWCSGLTLGGADVARGSIAAFCGPLTDVPHLIAACGISNGGIDVYIDWRPRAEAGYDLSLPTLADYPEPETRDAFAEGGNRKDFAAAFYTEQAAAIRASLLAAGGTAAPPLTKEQVSFFSAGPLLVDMRLPLSDAAAAAAADACTQATERWLEWMVNADEMKRGLPAGMRQTATYTRDTKVRANHFGFLLGRYTAIFGDADGKALAEADAGPLDEAYVGGGS